MGVGRAFGVLALIPVLCGCAATIQKKNYLQVTPTPSDSISRKIEGDVSGNRRYIGITGWRLINQDGDTIYISQDAYELHGGGENPDDGHYRLIADTLWNVPYEVGMPIWEGTDHLYLGRKTDNLDFLPSSLRGKSKFHGEPKPDTAKKNQKK